MDNPIGIGPSGASPPTGPSGPKRSPGTIIRDFAQLSSGFWRDEASWRAWTLTLGLFSFVLVSLAIQISYTLWNRYFFNALEQKDGAAVATGAQLILILTLAAAASGFTFNQVKMRLQLRWRSWLTRRLVGDWLADQRFYLLNMSGAAPSNPEHRVTEDVRVATELPADIAYGLTSSLLAATTFIGVLWAVGGSLEVPIGPASLPVPGYMVVGVVCYTAISSTLMALVGQPLIARMEHKNAGEANFRYEVTRVRESAEDIALIGGDGEERRRLEQTFTELVARWVGVIGRVARMAGLTNGNGTLAGIVPLLLAAPKYLSGALTLGEVMQLASAFLIVHQSLNWLADNAVRIAEWLASADRVVELAAALQSQATPPASPVERVTIADSPDDRLHIVGLRLADPGGTALIEGPDLMIARGERVLVQGPSGSGKSTLVRALAGLWPWGGGSILRPKGARTAFMLQRPYIPLGSLRHALTYPRADGLVSDARLAAILERCGLAHLVPRLAMEEAWSRSLSGGEQQRLAFARLLVDPPQIVVIDEATSALDETSEAHMMALFQRELAGVTVIGVGRRSHHERYYDRKIALVRGEGRPSRVVAA